MKKRAKSQKEFMIGGVPVRDALHDLVFHITPRDLAKAKPKDPFECAAAVACKREGKFAEVRVHLSRAYVRYPTHWKRYITPQSIRSEVIVLDRGGKFEPGEYVLEAPVSETLKLGYHKPRGPHKKKGKPRRPMHLVAGVRAGAPR